MENTNKFSWNIGELSIKLPIVQGGMGVGISSAGLASAVANEGGIGTIAAVGLKYINGNPRTSSADALKNEIEKARALTKGVLAVNIMCALEDFTEIVEAAIEAKIDVIFSGAGLPLDLPKFKTNKSKTKLIPIVSSAKAAKIIAKWWQDKYNYTPDGFVVEGPMAGGHLGFDLKDLGKTEFKLENLVTAVKAVRDDIAAKTQKVIPIIAGGGVFTGGDIKKFLSLGASAVQMGTRFVATNECDASDAFKEAYIKCTKEDIAIIKSPVGMPGRAIRNEFLISAQNNEKNPKECAFHCIKTCKGVDSPYCISTALLSAFKGKFENGFAFVGANGYRVEKIMSVKELINELMMEVSI